MLFSPNFRMTNELDPCFLNNKIARKRARQTLQVNKMDNERPKYDDKANRVLWGYPKDKRGFC